MRPIATDVARSVVCLCVLVTLVKLNCETRSSATEEGPRDELCY